MNRVLRGAFYTALPLLPLVALSACKTKGVKEFPLSIVVGARLGQDKGDKLPEDIVSISAVLESCPKYNFLPNPTLHRLGVEHGELPLKAKIAAGVAGNKRNPRFLNRQIEKHLAAMDIGPAFAAGGDEDLDVGGSLHVYLEAHPGESVLYYNSASGGGPGQEASGKVAFAEPESLRKAIADLLCKAPENDRVVVVYNVALLDDGSASPGGGSTKVLTALHEKNLEAGTNPEKLEHVRHEIEQAEDPADYRFTYELVKNRIYGAQHHEAFDLLRKAASIALAQGKAVEMLYQIERDEDGDLWKLSHGHKGEWGHVLRALTTGDKELLEEHHEHGPH